MVDLSDLTGEKGHIMIICIKERSPYDLLGKQVGLFVKTDNVAVPIIGELKFVDEYDDRFALEIGNVTDIELYKAEYHVGEDGFSFSDNDVIVLMELEEDFPI